MIVGGKKGNKGDDGGSSAEGYVLVGGWFVVDFGNPKASKAMMSSINQGKSTVTLKQEKIFTFFFFREH